MMPRGLDRSWCSLAMIILAVAGSGSVAQGSGKPRLPAVTSPDLRAVRTGARIDVDGALDEQAWSGAPVFSQFVQSYPSSGEPPSERTEVRILYDDRAIYFGVICYDSEPHRINNRLGRRDRVPYSDMVSVEIDSTHDHRSGYVFTVNAGGVLMDGVLFEDNQFSQDWDSTWDGAARMRADGWSAELAIPLRLLRFSAAPQQTWGVAVRRELSRRHEKIDSVIIPNESSSRVSLYGHLSGLENLRPRLNVAVTPYLAARTGWRPQYSDPARPRPRLFNPSLDVGVDVAAALTSDLHVTATINPDFGQVEADRLILNFSNFEVFFPEKRPFFTQGMDIFQPVGADGGVSPQMLFYSRRMGLDTPILGAVKLTGAVAPGWELGVVDVLVAGAADPSKLENYRNGEPIDEDDPDSRFQFHPARPFHLGRNHELPADKPVPRNYLAAIARGRVTGALTLGATLVAATPFSRSCQDVPAPERPVGESDCTPAGGSAVAVDWNLRGRGGVWGFLGQLDGSRASGSASSARVLPDGTRLDPGDMGLGTYMRAGKLGGEPWRFSLSYEYSSPRLELNPAGFQRSQNEQRFGGAATFIRPSGAGALRELAVHLSGVSRWTTDGRMESLGTGLYLGSEVVLPGFHTVGCELGGEGMRQDIREIGDTGLPLERPINGAVVCYGNTDTSDALSLNAFGFIGQTLSSGVSRSRRGAGLRLGATWSPHPRVQTALEGVVDSDLDGPRWIQDTGPGTALFAELDARTLSFTLRQIVVINPELTVQAYAQLFSGYGHHGPYYQGAIAGVSRVRLADLEPVEPVDIDDPSFHVSALNMNLVMRWEFRPGSILYLAYSRAQEEAPQQPFMRLTAPLWPHALFDGPGTDILLLKISYQWGT